MANHIVNKVQLEVDKNRFPFLVFIDDDEAINFLHELVVKKSGLCERYKFFTKAEDALVFFADLDSNETPSAIFIDINMPKIDGWEFLKRYTKLNLLETPIVIMLTTSLNPSDRQKAEANPLVYQFLNKPIKKEHLSQLLEKLRTP